MEVLSDILRSMRVTGSVYFCDALESPWTRTFKDAESASFHMIRRGQCWLIDADRLEALGPGDLVFAKPDQEHQLSSERPGEVTASPSSQTMLLCGYCRFDAPLGHPLLSSLPSLIVVRSQDLIEHAWLKSTLDQLSSEYMAQKPGSDIVVDKLTEVLLVELVRLNFGREERAAFIGALYDKPVSRALSLMHSAPQEPWTIDGLAAKVAMSRAALAKRFKERVGQTVFEYLTQLRMQKAERLLRGSRLPLYQVANQVGYESDLAFAKAFKRVLGVTPTRYRKRSLSM
jgi:AraC-like DNA-binding protein